ncbi:hypothetical protein ElyMa_002618900 [Elysia marginata]|uniref:WAP domain-containing protein n=1 Tax=Elysia marginata TaxID=1093978 RepID=A0AAV4H2M4_9GAST|nr:hypothetical protein ElyMa_002618900 [Elysia marginata]
MWSIPLWFWGILVCTILTCHIQAFHYNVPPQNQRDCSYTCDLSIEECSLENHCGSNQRCQGRCYDEGVRCYNQCVRWLLRNGNLRR